MIKGIVLAGGNGTRLYPCTSIVSKQLMPVYDKPMIYYPLAILMYAGIRDILIISTPDDLPNFKKLLGDGSQFGIKFSYAIQPSPDGIAQAFIIGEDFIAQDAVALVLGDNIFYSKRLPLRLAKAAKSAQAEGIATIFTHEVKNPERFGTIVFDKNQNIISIEEKPLHPKSNYAVTGLYFYDNNVIEYAHKLKPSARNELEITDLNMMYLKENRLNVEFLDSSFAWLDTGTPQTLLKASKYIQFTEEIYGFKIACLEEIACDLGYITREQMLAQANNYPDNEYYNYIRNLK